MHINNNKGSTTMEATLLFPVILMLILTIGYLSIIHYQNVVGAASAMQSANRTAVAWSYIGGSDPAMLDNSRRAQDFIRSSYYKERDPYRFIIDTKSSRRIAHASAYTLSMARSGGIEDYADSIKENNIGVQRRTGFFNSYIEVNIDKGYTNPLGNLFRIFGVGARQEEMAKARAPLQNEVEFIRNVDLLMDLLHDTGLLGK